MNFRLLATASLLLIAGAAQAQSLSTANGVQFPMLDGGRFVPVAGAKADVSDSFLVRNKVSIGATMQQETYLETNSKTGDKFMEEKALMYGVTVGFEQQLAEIHKIQYKGTLLTGSSDYTGAYQGGQYGDVVLKGQSRLMYELNATYKLAPQAWHGVVLGAGLGYRNLIDNLQEAGSSGYKRENSNLYAAFGIERAFSITQDWTVTPSVVLKKSIYSRQFSEIQEGVLLVHNQNNVNGFEFSAVIAKQNANGTKFLITPYVRSWDAADSVAVQGTMEPKNKTTEVGLTIALQF